MPSHALSFNPQASADEDPARLATGKRSYDSLEEPTLEQPLSVEAHSVAMDLGMISLHSDSRQKHYLGSSSGLLFMKLIGVGAAVQPSSPSSFAPTTASSRNIISRHRPREDTYYPLYSNLKKVSNTAKLLYFSVQIFGHGCAYRNLKGTTIPRRREFITSGLFPVYPHRASFSPSYLVN